MKAWLYEHRRLILAVYIALGVTVNIVLQILESRGEI